jgi:hypothetical protein
MPLTDEEKAQLLELAGKLEPSDDLSDLPIVPKAVLKGRLSDKDTARQALEAQYKAEMEELQRKHSEATAKLKQHEDKGKSDDEKLKELLAGYEQKSEAMEQRFEAEREARKALFLESQLQGLLGSSTAKPIQARHAMLAAMDELKPAVTEDDKGKLSLTIMQDGIPASKPGEVFAGWWEKQKHLHAAKGNQLPPPGGGHPPGDPPPKDPLDGLTPEQQMAHGMGTRY